MKSTLTVEVTQYGKIYTRTFDNGYKAVRSTGKNFNSKWSLYDKDNNFKGRNLNLEEVQFLMNQ